MMVRPGQQDREGDLVRGALALRPLHQGDHPAQERLAVIVISTLIQSEITWVPLRPMTPRPSLAP